MFTSNVVGSMNYWQLKGYWVGIGKFQVWPTKFSEVTLKYMYYDSEHAVQNMWFYSCYVLCRKDTLLMTFNPWTFVSLHIHHHLPLVYIIMPISNHLNKHKMYTSLSSCVFEWFKSGVHFCTVIEKSQYPLLKCVYPISCNSVQLSLVLSALRQMTW